jgi:EAL domain-containing protein (putative c-di-GMP-specific phosphodiesterase class I)
MTEAVPAMIGNVNARELTLFYQPQYLADGKTIHCVEALLRHNHPIRGRVGPADVLRQLDTPDLMEQLDWWVLARACRDALAWGNLPVSINISATQFRAVDFATRVIEMVGTSGIAPARVELEIVEAAIIEDFDLATRNIDELRRAGMRIALDDFGTGFSSLTYLLRMPLDKLKIDKCFVDDCENMRSASIIHALVALARAVGLKVTAEGVETEGQHRVLRAAGVHYMQGFLFAGAVSADGITRLLGDNAGMVPRPTIGAIRAIH